MTAKILSVSVSSKQFEFMEQYGLSASALLQTKIEDLIESQKISAIRLKEEIRKMESWKQIAETARDFIRKEGLFDKFMKEQGY